MTDGVAEAGVPEDLRQKLCLALDVDDLVAANRLARELKPWFGVVKVGLELFTAVGPDAIGTMIEQGYKVFVDLKLHDIPNTVERAAKVLGSLGASYLTMHAHGGAPMLRAGVSGLHEGAASAGLPEPVAVAVTVLTSDADAPEHIVPTRIRVAAEGGCQGIVCAVGDLADVRTLTPRLIKVVPGIRPEGAPADDQARVGTPQQALDEGADLLVIGRPITRAEDPAEAATALVASVG
jgi:orotidine-5'-phosphate decarboxylase